MADSRPRLCLCVCPSAAGPPHPSGQDQTQAQAPPLPPPHSALVVTAGARKAWRRRWKADPPAPAPPRARVHALMVTMRRSQQCEPNECVHGRRGWPCRDLHSALRGGRPALRAAQRPARGRGALYRVAERPESELRCALGLAPAPAARGRHHWRHTGRAQPRPRHGARKSVFESVEHSNGLPAGTCPSLWPRD